MSQPNPLAEARAVVRSTFVTVLAWVLIVGSGFETFISLMQAVMLTFFFPESFWSNTQPLHGIEKFPPLMQLLFSNAQYWFLAFWLLSAITLVSSIALLRRKNWARLIVVAILTLGIVWSLGMIWLQSEVFSDMPKSSSAIPTQSKERIETMVVVMRVGATIFASGLAALFAWIVKRLLSRPIRIEFGAP